jgi:hypothetical protein
MGEQGLRGRVRAANLTEILKNWIQERTFGDQITAAAEQTCYAAEAAGAV